MSLQEEYNEFCRGYWADPDPNVCLCRGSGYALSDLDTWHECPYHYKKGQQHPEDDYEPAQCLEDNNPKEKLKMPEDITEEDLKDMEFSPVPPPPPKPLTEDEIPF